jgi:hypothetical protein
VASTREPSKVDGYYKRGARRKVIALYNPVSAGASFRISFMDVGPWFNNSI